MSAEIVNLRRARKTRDRAAAKARAAENDARHGESKAARKRREAEATLERRRLEGLKRDEPGD